MWIEEINNFHNELKCHQCQRPLSASEKLPVASRRLSLPARFFTPLEFRIPSRKLEALRKTRFSVHEIGRKDTPADEFKITKSETLPKISRCRKIENLNIVLPLGPKLDLILESDENSPPSSLESKTIGGETDDGIKKLKKHSKILFNKRASSSDSYDSGFEVSSMGEDIVSPETPSSPQIVGNNSTNRFNFSSSTSEDKMKDPRCSMGSRRLSTSFVQLFSQNSLTPILEDPPVPDEPVVASKNIDKSLPENSELKAVEKRPVVDKAYKTGLVEGIIAELQKKCSTKVKPQFSPADIYENQQDAEEEKEEEKNIKFKELIKQDTEEEKEKKKKLKFKELIKQMEKDLKLKKENEMKMKDEEKNEMKKKIEKEMKDQREKEMKKQRELEMKIVKMNNMNIQREMEMKFQEEMRMKSQKEIEMKKQRRMELKIQREMELKIQREIELKRERELELKRQRDMELKKEREIEIEKIREIEAKLQREKPEMKRKEKENAARRQKEIEDEVDLELSFDADTSLIEDVINEMEERFNETSLKNSSSVFDPRSFIKRLSLDAQDRAKKEKYKTYKVSKSRRYKNRNESHQKSLEYLNNGDYNKENDKNYSDLRIYKSFHPRQSY